MSSVLAADGIPVARTASLRPLTTLALLSAGVVAGGLTAWAAAQSPVLAAPDAAAVLRGLIVFAYVAAGTFTWERRPSERFGSLLIVLGLTYALTGFIVSQDEVLHTAGRLLTAAWAGLYVYVFLAFPSGRLGTALERTIVRVYVVGALILWPIVLVTTKTLPAAGVFTDCAGRCPHNGLRAVDASPSLAHAAVLAVSLMTAAVALAAVYVLARKSWSQVRLERVTVAPVLLAAVVVILSYVVFSLHPTGGAGRVVNLAVAGTAALFAPIAFFFAPLRGELFVSRGSAGPCRARLLEAATGPGRGRVPAGARRPIAAIRRARAGRDAALRRRR